MIVNMIWWSSAVIAAWLGTFAVLAIVDTVQRRRRKKRDRELVEALDRALEQGTLMTKAAQDAATKGLRSMDRMSADERGMKE